MILHFRTSIDVIISPSLISISNDFYLASNCVEVSKISIVVIQFPYAIGHSFEWFCVTKNIIFFFIHYSVHGSFIVIYYYCWKKLNQYVWIEKSFSSYVCMLKRVSFIKFHFEESRRKSVKEKRPTELSIYNLYSLLTFASGPSRLYTISKFDSLLPSWNWKKWNAKSFYWIL